MSTGPEHYREAERILAVAVAEHDRLSTRVDSVEQITALRRAVGDMIAAAQVHATLAQVAATAEIDVCGRDDGTGRSTAAGQAWTAVLR